MDGSLDGLYGRADGRRPDPRPDVLLAQASSPRTPSVTRSFLIRSSSRTARSRPTPRAVRTALTDGGSVTSTDGAGACSVASPVTSSDGSGAVSSTGSDGPSGRMSDPLRARFATRCTTLPNTIGAMAATDTTTHHGGEIWYAAMVW